MLPATLTRLGISAGWDAKLQPDGEWADGTELELSRRESSPDRPTAPLHVHRRGDEAWYVLEGSLGVRLGDAVHIAGSGAAIVAKRGTAHTFWNAGEAQSRYIIAMAPEIHALIKSLHSAGSDRSALEARFAAHDSELL
jgi:mannose-6-phosphate isomerase-like protein (cupin superfamily)